jgi:parallel beta-helix repeat protein
MLRLSTAVLGLAVVAACDTAPTEPVQPAAATAGARFGAPDVVVSPGGSLQAAVDAAGAGGVVHVLAGTYAQSVSVTQPGVRIVGITGADGAPVIIENPGGVRNGVDVRGAAHGFALVNVTVRGFDANGVFLSGIDDFLLSRVTAESNGAYGLFPVRANGGVIEHSAASGHADAGLYVGQSSNVTMRNNRVFENVVGIEASNSSSIKLLHNEAWDNSNGILAVLLPGRQIRTAGDMTIAGNIIRDNNRPNFADPEDLVAAVPAGTGILVVGADRVLVEGNTVIGNAFIGIGVGSSMVLAALSGGDPTPFLELEPDPEGVRVSRNTVTGNGTASPIPFLPPADLLWDGSGAGNCWAGNTFTSSFPELLPDC